MRYDEKRERFLTTSQMSYGVGKRPGTSAAAVKQAKVAKSLDGRLQTGS